MAKNKQNPETQNQQNKQNQDFQNKQNNKKSNNNNPQSRLFDKIDETTEDCDR